MSAADRQRAIGLGIGIACAAALALAGCSSNHSTAAPRPTGFAPTGAIGDPPPSVKVAAPSAPTGAIAKVPATIADDCSVDVTAALQSWIDSVPDNSTAAFRSKGCYRADRPLFVRNRYRMVIDGNGATLKAVTQGGRNRSQLVLGGGSDLTVRNLITRGANPKAGATRAAYNPDLEAQHGFLISGATNVLLDHVQVYDTYGDFVYIGPGVNQGQASRNVTIANSRFERSGRQGIAVTAAVGVNIEANSIGGVARSMFDLEANSAGAIIRDIRIVGNVTGAAVNFWLANKGYVVDIGDITIARNRMDVATGGLLFVYGGRRVLRGPYTIEQNRFIAGDKVNDENSTGAFFFASATDVTIRDNDVAFPKGRNMPVVEIRNSHHVDVTGNHFRDAGRVILASQGSSDYRAS